MNKKQVAILDDYQHAATSFADWSVLNNVAEVTFFHDHESNESNLIQRLLPFNIVCVMRERTPLTMEILSQLPKLELIVSTGARNASLDTKAAEELGITVKNTRYVSTGAPELSWALLMAIARHIPLEHRNITEGKWQTTVGTDLKGKTIGIIGLGKIGKKMAAYAKAFDMKVIAWSENLTPGTAAEAGAIAVSKEILFREADFITIHLVLSERSKNTVQKADLELMKPTAYLINTSRGPIIKQADLIEILQQRKIRGAALDVFDTEPLPADHPFRKMDNVLATPHIGYVTEETYKVFFEDTVKAILEFQ